MQVISTNDVFHHLLLLLRIHKDKDLIIEIFASQKRQVSKSLIKAWATKSGEPKPDYREMPREALDDFINGLHEYKLFGDNND